MSKLAVEIFSLSLLYCLEGMFPLFEGRQGRGKHALINVLIGILNASLTALLFLGLMVAVLQWSEVSSMGLLRWLRLPYFWGGLVSFLLMDLWMYLWHIANHRIPFFWRFHRAHHADQEMDCTTALRFHPGEILLSAGIRLAVLPLLGLSFNQLLFYDLCLLPVILFHHSNVALPEKWDRILRAWMVTPNMHRVHHSQVREETNSNYASIFSFWDRIGKTYVRKDVIQTIVYGLPEFSGPEWQKLLNIFAIPFAPIGFNAE